MTKRNLELQSIVRLLDDDHPAVRRAVQQRLAAYGPGLRAALREAVPDLTSGDLNRALELGRQQKRDRFREAWHSWLDQPSGFEKMENGHFLLANYLAPGDEEPLEISEELSQLAMDHELEAGEPDFRSLAAFLFGSGQFSGARDRYYHPDSSNLAAVLQTGEGNPISLACIFILVGSRLGLDVGGCNYPVHFLARAQCPQTDELFLVDCFNEGRIIHSQDLIEHHPLTSDAVTDVVMAPASAELILSRVLRNLENAFQRDGQEGERRFMRELWRMMAESESKDDF